MLHPGQTCSATDCGAWPPLVRNPGGSTLERSSRPVDDSIREQALESEYQNTLSLSGNRIRRHSGPHLETPISQPERKASRFATNLYIWSYLILFSILGTLSRIGLQSLTFYPGNPVAFGVLWANFTGSLLIGFFSEDCILFKDEWGIPKYHQQLEDARIRAQSEGEEPENPAQSMDPVLAKKAHMATKKTIPLYIGFTTGFCGSLTSFSSFIRDVFLALSNDLIPPPSYVSKSNQVGPMTSTMPRNGGYSFMALVAVTIVTVAVCVSGLNIGTHISILLAPNIPSVKYVFMRKIMDPLAVMLAWGSWLGAILLAVWPPDRYSVNPEIWRGRVVFAIVFAPAGCLCRFYASLHLNGKIASFPLGTFLVNICGTAILGMAWNLQHLPVGGMVGCQVLQGIQDGLCGCLTTVSTWVSELTTLKRSHAYRYGAVSILMGLCFLLAIMGSLRWTRGFAQIFCVQ